MSDDWTDESDDDVIIETDDEDSDSGMEATEPPPQPEETPEPEAPPKKPRGRPPKPIVPRGPKVRKPMTQAQLDALARGRETRNKNRKDRMAQREVEAVEKKKIKEANLVKKAVKIKKKEVLEEASYLLSSEDDMDELEVKQVKRIVAKRKAKAKKENAKPTPKRVAVEEPKQNEYIFY